MVSGLPALNSEDAHWHEHAANGSAHWQDGLADVGKLPYRHLVLDFQAHQKEEHRHEHIVDDVGQRHFRMVGTEAHHNLGMPEFRERTMRSRVRHHQRNDGGQEHDARRLSG